MRCLVTATTGLNLTRRGAVGGQFVSDGIRGLGREKQLPRRLRCSGLAALAPQPAAIGLTGGAVVAG
jgi:hypothetical protein